MCTSLVVCLFLLLINGVAAYERGSHCLSASGCKPKDKWRIGTEHEKFGFEVNTLRPMKYDQIAKLLNSIAERFEWEKVMEGDKIILIRRGFKSVRNIDGGYIALMEKRFPVKVELKHDEL